MMTSAKYNKNANVEFTLMKNYAYQLKNRKLKISVNASLSFFKYFKFNDQNGEIKRSLINLSSVYVIKVFVDKISF